MSIFYTKTQVDQQATIIGQRIRTAKEAAKAYTDSLALTTTEREKLTGLESSKYLGTFLTSEAIPTENAVAGNYADVDSGPENVVSRWIFDADTRVFVKSASDVAGETAASVKTKYEANPNTNAFTDAEKGKLAGLVNTDLTVAADINDFLLAFESALSEV